MGSLIMSLMYCKYNLKMLVQGSRLYISFIAVFLLSFVGLRPLSEYAGAHNNKINIFELFSHFCSSRISVLFIVLGLVILLCDAPFWQDGTKYLLLRGTKKAYLIGQVFYISCTSFIYFLWIELCMIITACPNITLVNEWSKPVKLASSNTSAVGLTLDINFFDTIISESTPMQQFIRSFVCMILLGIFIGLFIFVINLYTNSMLGNIIFAVLLVLDYALDEILVNGSIGYYSPISMARISMQNLGYSPTFPKLNYVVGFYLCSYVLMIGMILWKLRTCELDVRGVKA